MVSSADTRVVPLSCRSNAGVAHAPRPELLDRVDLVDPRLVHLPFPQIVLGVATPKTRVPAQPVERISSAHFAQGGGELSIEEQEGEELAARAITRSEHAGHDREGVVGLPQRFEAEFVTPSPEDTARATVGESGQRKVAEVSLDDRYFWA